MGIRFRVTGRVQGVGFRAFTHGKAWMLGVRGWCRNTEDGAVEGEAEGEEGPLGAFVLAIEEGPPASRADQVLTVDADVGPFEGFDIRR